MMVENIVFEGWLTRLRDAGISFPPFKAKWVKRYFVLRQKQMGGSTFMLDEYRCAEKKRLRKSFDLVKCDQIDSYLSLSESSCATHFNQSEWIFSLHIARNNSHKKREIFFVAENEFEMNSWVNEMCKACGLEIQSTVRSEMSPLPYREQEAPLAYGDMAGSEWISMESLLDRTISDVTSEAPKENYVNAAKKKSRQTLRNRTNSPSRQLPESQGSYENPRKISKQVPSSGSLSVSSSHPSITTDFDGTCSSQSILDNGSQAPTSSRSNDFPRGRAPNLDQVIPAQFTAPHGEWNLDNESSGETIRIHPTSISKGYPPRSVHSLTLPAGSVSGSASKASSVSSSMRFGPSRSNDPNAPPVDRSKKPSKLRLDQDDDRFSMDSYGTHANSSTLTRYPRTPQLSNPSPRPFHREPPKSAGPLTSQRSHLEYFEPTLHHTTIERRSRRPGNSDLEYIQIDSDRTQAVARANTRGTID